MTAQAYYGTFNARWLPAEDVATRFVPVPQFGTLAHNNHSVLLGPRGCGKTTLLKMLTRPALEAWASSNRSVRFAAKFQRPRFEAVYIPSDVRWCYELSRVDEDTCGSKELSTITQRVMVCANALLHILITAERILTSDVECEPAICSALIKQWRFKNTLSTFADLRATLAGAVGGLRGMLNSSNAIRLDEEIKKLPASFYGHVLDAPTEAIMLITDLLPKEQRPPYWALCYDELEIAPEWLRFELLESLRSSAQNILLKLTWTPLLPSGLRTSPESAADFRAIRLWHSHVRDPRAFCEELATDFLDERFPGQSLTPNSFFSRSVLASEADEEPPEAYSRGSTEYEVFKDLAAWDDSFRRLLRSRNVDPDDPVPSNSSQKDQLFRKVKPIALLRSEFKSANRDRTRKAVTLYAGREAVYALSEGNPRWLLGLLNDLAELYSGRMRTRPDVVENLPYADQAKTLNAASRRFQALIKASAFRPPARNAFSTVTLHELIGRIGEVFRDEIYAKDFPLDPIGSFEVPNDSDLVVVAMIEQLLELGAVVYIGSSPEDIPVEVRGSRFRLSFMLAPAFRLPLRTYREMKLGEVLSGLDGREQLELSL